MASGASRSKRFADSGRGGRRTAQTAVLQDRRIACIVSPVPLGTGSQWSARWNRRTKHLPRIRHGLFRAARKIHVFAAGAVTAPGPVAAVARGELSLRAPPRRRAQDDRTGSRFRGSRFRQADVIRALAATSPIPPSPFTQTGVAGPRDSLGAPLPPAKKQPTAALSWRECANATRLFRRTSKHTV